MRLLDRSTLGMSAYATPLRHSPPDCARKRAKAEAFFPLPSPAFAPHATRAIPWKIDAAALSLGLILLRHVAHHIDYFSICHLLRRSITPWSSFVACLVRLG